MSLWMFVAYGAVPSLSCHANAVAGKPVPMAYAAVFSALLLISLSTLLFPLWKAPTLRDAPMPVNDSNVMLSGALSDPGSC